MKTEIILLCLSICACATLNAQIENGMVAHFPFNDDLNDVSSSSIVAVNNGTVFGPDRNGVPNYAVELSGSDYVSFNDTAVKVPLPITISAWVKIGNIGGNTADMIFTSDNVYGDFHGYGMYVLPSSQPMLSMSGGLGGQDDGNRRAFMGGTQLQSGVWYHILGVIRDYNDMSLYVDCSELSGNYVGSGSTTIAYSSTDSRIGHTEGGPNFLEHFFDGSIDQLAIWNRALTESEVQYLCDMNNPLAIEEVQQAPKELVRVIDLLGRDTPPVLNTPLIYLYNDGSAERVFKME